MKNLKEIEQAISGLPPQQLAVLRAWFARFDAVSWDKQFEEDVHAKKLDKLASKALLNYKNGKVKPL
jgi:hypothetical protein